MILEVGKRVPGLPKMADGPTYSYAGGQHLMILSFPTPSPREVLGVRKGTVSLRVIGNDLALFVLFKIPDGGIEWSDAPFEWSLVPPDQRNIPELGERKPWTVILLEAETQLIKAIRIFTPDPAFQHKHNEAIRLQALRTTPALPEETAKYIRAMTRYTSAELAAMAAGTRPPDPTLGSKGFVLAMRSYRSGSPS